MSPRHTPYADRAAGGRALAAALPAVEPPALVLALPRGGVPVAAEVARALGVPLDVLVVRKLGLPGSEELAMGAIASGGGIVVDDALLDRVRLPREELARVARREAAEVARRERAYRGDRPPPDLTGATAVLVDDGLATGATMHAAVHAARALGAQRVIAAAPVGSEQACEGLAAHADAVICPLRPSRFRSVGRWYRDFTQLSDAEVQRVVGRGP